MAQPSADPATSPVGTTDRFRIDIQALRAVAVGLVVVNHLWPSWVPGGYAGVDVFFVISGYLITSHLRREVDATGRVRLGAFWARRARRLLPAAMTVLAFCLLVTILWAPITSVRPGMNQIAAAGTYSLNWVLAASTLNYFNAGTGGTTVTHYWSLSVEEQFYLLWPLVTLGCALLARRSAGAASRVDGDRLRRRPRRVAALGSASRCRCGRRPPTSRPWDGAWEFAAGGLLTFVRSPGPRNWTVPVMWAAWLGLLVAGLRLGPLSGFPGVAALLPVGATAVIIWIRDSDHAWAPTRLTALPPVQFLGRISYSLYLWHWPLIIAAPMLLHVALSTRTRIAVLVLSVVLAYLSSRFIEDPVRLSRHPLLLAPRWVLVFTAGSMALLCALTSWVTFAVDERSDTAARVLYDASMSTDPCFGAKAVLAGPQCANVHTLTQADAVLVDNSRQIRAVPSVSECLSNQGEPVARSCEFGLPAGDDVVDIALVGDSHAEVWTHALERVAATRRIRVRTYLQAGCPPALDDRLKYLPATDPAIMDGCRTWRDTVIASVAADPSVDLVITASKDRSYLLRDGSPDLGDGYLAAWRLWLDAGKRVIVINDVPDYGGTIVPHCIAASASSVDPCTMPVAVVAPPGPVARAASLEHDARFRFVDFNRCSAMRHCVIPLSGAFPPTSTRAICQQRSPAPSRRSSSR